jgi:hypothetical protein
MYDWQLSRAVFLILTLAAAAVLWWLISLIIVRKIDEDTANGIRLKLESRPAQILVLSCIGGLFLFNYLPAVTFTFFGDDFYYLSLLSEGMLRVVLPIEKTHHYYPVFMLAAGIPQWFHMNEAAAYHSMSIALHLVNGILVYLLALRVMGKKTVACGAAALFVFYFLNYDPVLWTLGGMPYILSTFLALLSFLLFLRYRESGERRFLWGFITLFVFALFASEVIAPLIVVCLFYDLTHGAFSRFTPRRLFRALSIYILSALAISSQVVVKYFYTHALVVSHNNLHKLMQNFLSTCCFLGPFNNMTSFWLFSRWGQNDVVLAVSSVAAISATVFLFARTNTRFRMMLLWMAFFSGPVILMSESSPRYFYSSSIGWAIFWAGAFQAMATGLAKRFPFPRFPQKVEQKGALAFLAAILLFGAITIQGIGHHLYLLGLWRRGNDMIVTSVTSTAELIRQHPQKKRILVVDQPTWLRGNDFYGVLLLIDNMDVPLKTLAGIDGVDVRSVRLEAGSEFNVFPKLSREDIESAAFDADTLVIRYDKHTFQAYEQIPLKAEG